MCVHKIKTLLFIYILAFRSHRAQKVAKELYKTKAMDQSRAAVLIQTYFRQWKCKSVYQQLQQYKSQKELQLIYFTQQVIIYRHMRVWMEGLHSLFCNLYAISSGGGSSHFQKEAANPG